MILSQLAIIINIFIKKHRRAICQTVKNKPFCKLKKASTDRASAEAGPFAAMAENIRENGLFVCGFFARATAEDFVRLSEKEHVAYIDVV